MICQGRLFFACFSLVFFLSACGGSHDGWTSFPVAISADQRLAASPTFQSDFQDAIAFWEGKAGKPLFSYQGAYTGGTPYVGSVSAPDSVTNNVVMLQDPWPFATTIVGQTMVTSSNSTISAAMILINPDTDFCSGDCDGQETLTSERKVLAHELGHFIGLVHVTDPANLMYPTSLPGGSLSEVTIDDAAFQKLITAN
jgi:hypothetical protein